MRALLRRRNSTHDRQHKYNTNLSTLNEWCSLVRNGLQGFNSAVQHGAEHWLPGSDYFQLHDPSARAIFQSFAKSFVSFPPSLSL